MPKLNSVGEISARKIFTNEIVKLRLQCIIIILLDYFTEPQLQGALFNKMRDIIMGVP